MRKTQDFLFQQRTQTGHRHALYRFLHEEVSSKATLPLPTFNHKSNISDPIIKTEVSNGPEIIESLNSFDKFSTAVFEACKNKNKHVLRNVLYAEPVTCPPNLKWINDVSAEMKQMKVHHFMAKKNSKITDITKEFESRGVFYPLLLCAENMPTLNDWLPVEYHENCAIWQDFLTDINTAKNSEKVLSIIKSNKMDWSSMPGRIVAQTLDSACILMRIHSTKCENLDKLLENLNEPKDIVERWESTLNILRNVLPPSMLLPIFNSDPVWGYEKLCLSVSGEKVLLIPGKFHKVSKCNTKNKSYIDSACNIIVKLTNQAMSEPVKYVMCFPDRGLKILQDRSVSNQIIYPSKDNLKVNKTDVFKFIQELSQKMPGIEIIDFQQPQKIFAWKVEPPDTVIHFTGKFFTLNYFTFAPHTLKKTYCKNETNLLKTISGVHCVAKKPNHKTIVQALSHYAKVHLKQENEQTSLIEGLASFIKEPELKKTIPVHCSTKWDHSHEDPRYSETQEGSNGFKYRDWVALSNDKSYIEKCKLVSHYISADKFYTTKLPWIRLGKSVQWVSVVSSLRPDVKIILEKPVKDSKEFNSFFSSVKGNVYGLIPSNCGITSKNMDIYPDENQNQVLFCFAPTDNSNFEFMLFQK